MITVTIELEPAEAAGLKRFAAKVTHAHTLSVLYGHVPASIRGEQSYTMLAAFAKIERALEPVATYPWIETGAAT